MENIKIIEGQNFSLCNIETNEINDLNYYDNTYIRVKLPALYENQSHMRKLGFTWVDRMLLASINLKKNADLSKMIRLKVVETNDYLKDIYRIAYESFPIDRRFHVTKDYNDYIAKQIINYYIEEVQIWLICFFKDVPIGFVGLIEKNENVMEIHLAAVDEKYRSTGAANSLYAYTCDYCKNRNYKKLIGRISSVNMSVMNLYISLGATFSQPEDIYVK